MPKLREHLIQLIGVLFGIILLILAVIAYNHPTTQSILISVGASVLASSLFSIFLLATVGNPFDEIRTTLNLGMHQFQALFQQTSAIFNDAQISGLTRVSSSRSDIPIDEWIRRLSKCESRIFIIAYAMDFLSEHEQFVALLAEKCAIGCCVRLLLADPEGHYINQRSIEEVNEGSIKSRVETTIARLHSVTKLRGFELRLYDVPLYCSVFGFDDEMIVTPHLYGIRGARAPVMIVRNTRNGLFNKYLKHFEDIWATGRPVPSSPSNLAGDVPMS